MYLFMLKFLKWFFGMFSPYVNSFERKVDKFFRNVKSTDNFFSINKKLLDLMRENLIVVNVWMERKYKGYRYLNKKTRRRMYKDVLAINSKFEEFSNAMSFSEDSLKENLASKGFELRRFDMDQLRYLYQIMQFLKPGHYYHYIQTASFGKLLRDPNVDKLEGDCNQIVTLYIYLFSLKFPIENLRIKLLPGHVCLHFDGVDIEATSGEFENYVDDKQILPVTEIISTNMLDLTDFREGLQKISERTLVKSSQLAYAISSLRSIVEKNLNIAYKNLAVSALNSKKFDSAIFYSSKLSDKEFLNQIYRSAAVYYMEQNNFSKAMFYSKKVADSKLEKTIMHNEGVYCYQNGKIDKALKIFSSLSDEKMKRACYAVEYNKLAKKVADLTLLSEMKKQKSVYRKMLNLARLMGDSAMEDDLRDLLNKL